MKLDRNVNSDGWGKYALVLMRKLIPIMRHNADNAKAVAVREAFELLVQEGVIRIGNETPESQFFVLGYGDKFTPPALLAYQVAVKEFAMSLPENRRAEWVEFSREMHTEFCLSVPIAKNLPF